MEVNLLEMAIEALGIVFDPSRLVFLFLGVVLGLVFGVIPGLGGLVGLALLLPFTFALEPYSGLAMLIGLGAVIATSDSIPAILFGVPGTSGAAATVMDGHPMARRGDASRAFGAAFTASMLGGLFGALILGLSIPFLRPVMLSIATPEMLALIIFGLTLVATLGGKSAAKGMAAACIGLFLATVGEEYQMGEWRWTFGSLYLWEGLPIVPIALGLFALPELADLAIRRQSVTTNVTAAKNSTKFQGAMDVLKNPFLTFRCSAIGCLIGAIPGLGSAVVDWIAYGHAIRTEKGADKTFGKGDVRGVIATETANNSKEGGALVTTIAFGVPGSASMALLLSAFVVYGIIPGPDMLSKNLDVTYSLVWSIVFANIFGAALCFLFVGQLAKLALVRPGILVPIILAICVIGAYQSRTAWADIYVLLSMGVLGFVMKRLAWPRPPLLLGFVLGAIFERYMFLSVNIYGFEWLTRPVVAVVLALALYGLLVPVYKKWLFRRRERQRGYTISLKFGRNTNVNYFDLLFTGLLIVLFTVTFFAAADWHFDSRLVPQVISVSGVLFCLFLAVSQLFMRIESDSPSVQTIAAADLSGEYEGMERPVIFKRTAQYFAGVGFYLVAAWLIGLLPAMAAFVVVYMRFIGRERWRLSLLIALIMFTFAYLLFHHVLDVVWPQALMGELLPLFRETRALRLM